MGQQQKILVKPHALGARAATACGLLMLVSLLNGCGQRGPLTMPNDEEFKQRATLPDIIRRQLPDLPNASSNKVNTPTPKPISSPTAPAPSQPASSAQPPAVNR
jgi:predicted small lipoprotein YifL